jgi:putative oxidoreductase
MEVTMSTLALTLSRANAITESFAVTRYAPIVGRIFLATIFLFSGVGKIAAPEATIGYIASSGLPFPELAYLAAVLVEVGGGVLLIAGYQTRLTALALAGFSIVTALAFHNTFADQNQLIHFLKNIGLAGGLLQVVAFGAGDLSIDGKSTDGKTRA